MVALEGVLSLRISPPFSWVHLHRKYSIYRHELNHAQQAEAGEPIVQPSSDFIVLFILDYNL